MNLKHIKSITSLGFGLGLAMAMASVLSAAGLRGPEPALPQPPSGAARPKQGAPSKPASPSDDLRRGYIAAPPGSQTLSVAMDPTSMQLFEKANFEGTQELVLGKGKMIPPGQPQDLQKGLHDSISSLRWQLPHGIVVILYEDATMKGEQMVLWGSGQLSDLNTWDFNDKASRWAWYNVGGGSVPSSAPPSAEAEQGKLPPHGSATLSTPVPENTIQFSKDQKFGGHMDQVYPVTTPKAGELQKLSGAMDDSLTSVRWNLPEGVIVVLYENADGKRDRVAIWGKGELTDLDLWDFNDKVSRWSWTYIGAPQGQ